MAETLGWTLALRLLTTRHRNAFREQGYCIIRSALSRADITQVRMISAELYERKAGLQRGDFLDLAGDDSDPEAATLPQILMPVHYAPQLAQTNLRSAAELIGRGVYGALAEYQGEHLIAKPPGTGSPTLPHQDEAFWDPKLRYDCISIWIPLQDVDERNGCLYFAPGSHLRGIRDHRLAAGETKSNSFELNGRIGEFTPEPMRAGDISIHHCRTIHGAGSNYSNEHRYAYIYGFGIRPQAAGRSRRFAWQEKQATLRMERARAGRYALTKMRPEAN